MTKFQVFQIGWEPCIRQKATLQTLGEVNILFATKNMTLLLLYINIYLRHKARCNFYNQVLHPPICGFNGSQD